MRPGVAAAGLVTVLCLASTAPSAQVQKPTLAIWGSSDQYGADFKSKLHRRLAVVFTVNPDGPVRWGMGINVPNPYQSPIIYSVTFLENCGGQWCWRQTFTANCPVDHLDDCANRMFDVMVDLANDG